MVRTLFGRRELSCAILGLLTFLPLLALAAPPTTPQKLQQRQTQAPNPVVDECGFDGDDNTYGLGIRIGVYLQWVTSAIAYGFLPTEAESLRGVNNCFQAAMFAGLLFITIDKGRALYAVEAYIMLIFCMGGVCSGDTRDDGGIFKAKKFAYYRASNLGGLVRFALSTGFCVYGLWFFFTGMDQMRATPCSTWAYFFAKVNLYTWLRTFMKAAFVLMGIIHAIIIFMPLAFKMCCYPTTEDDSFELAGIGQSSDTGTDPPKSKAVAGFEGTRVVILSGSLVSFVLTVELMIQWNNIKGVNEMGSTGQLLPLIMAVGTLVRVLRLLKREGKFKKDETCGDSTL